MKLRVLHWLQEDTIRKAKGRMEDRSRGVNTARNHGTHVKIVGRFTVSLQTEKKRQNGDTRAFQADNNETEQQQPKQLSSETLPFTKEQMDHL